MHSIEDTDIQHQKASRRRSHLGSIRSVKALWLYGNGEFLFVFSGTFLPCKNLPVFCVR